MQKNYIKITTRNSKDYPAIKEYAHVMSNEKKTFNTVYKKIVKYFQVDITDLLAPEENKVEFFTTHITPEMIIEDLKNIKPNINCEVLIEYADDSMIEYIVKNGVITNVFNDIL